MGGALGEGNRVHVRRDAQRPARNGRRHVQRPEHERRHGHHASTPARAPGRTSSTSAAPPARQRQRERDCGLLVVNGQGAADTLNVDETGEAARNTGFLTSTRIWGLGMPASTASAAGITYGSIEVLNISLGAGRDDFTILSTHTRHDVAEDGRRRRPGGRANDCGPDGGLDGRRRRPGRRRLAGRRLAGRPDREPERPAERHRRAPDARRRNWRRHVHRRRHGRHATEHRHAHLVEPVRPRPLRLDRLRGLRATRS